MGLSLDASPPGTYRQRGASSLQRLFRTHFPDMQTRYEADFAKHLGRFRLQRISSAAERFLDCGDYTQGIEGIQCSNPECKTHYFRPFSCKVLYLCSFCSQKRTLLFGEYINEHLLVLPPHRQMVFTFPKLLRAFFRHDRRLYCGSANGPVIINSLKTAEQRVAIARRILDAVRAAGMTDADLIIDCLTLAVSADQSVGPVALETMHVVSKELGLKVNMGVSNISFGLPDRPLLNATFIAMACAAGLICAIANPHMTPVVDALRAADALLGPDRRAMGFLKAWRAKEKAEGGAAG